MPSWPPARPSYLLGRGDMWLLAEMAPPNGVFMGTRLNTRLDPVEWLEVFRSLALKIVVVGVAAGSEREPAGGRGPVSGRRCSGG